MRTLGATQFVFVDTPGFQTLHANALNRSLNKTVQVRGRRCGPDSFRRRGGQLHAGRRAGAQAARQGHSDRAAGQQARQRAPPRRHCALAADHAGEARFAEFVPMSAKNSKDIERLFGICEKYLPEQPWFYAEDELTDRSEKFLAGEMVREKLFRLTGDELPYTSTVIIDKFEEEPPAKKGQKRLLQASPPRSSSSATATRPWSSATRASASSASAPRPASRTRKAGRCQGLPRALGQGSFRMGRR
jgi:GTP-binding protein Era